MLISILFSTFLFLAKLDIVWSDYCETAGSRTVETKEQCKDAAVFLKLLPPSVFSTKTYSTGDSTKNCDGELCFIEQSSMRLPQGCSVRVIEDVGFVAVKWNTNQKSIRKCGAMRDEFKCICADGKLFNFRELKNQIF